MKTIEEMIDELPFNIYKEVEEPCYKCGTIHRVQLKYELTIRLMRHFDEKGKGHTRYFIYYDNNKLPSGYTDKYIGRCAGFGQATIEEAINELKGYIKNDKEL